MAKKTVSKTTIVKSQGYTNLSGRKQKFKAQKRQWERLKNALLCKNTMGSGGEINDKKLKLSAYMEICVSHFLFDVSVVSVIREVAKQRAIDHGNDVQQQVPLDKCVARP